MSKHDSFTLFWLLGDPPLCATFLSSGRFRTHCLMTALVGVKV